MAKSLLIYASSLPNQNSASSPPSPKTPKTPKPPLILPITTTTPNKTKKKHVQQQLQLLRVERAIGAGSYRDAEPSASDENTLGSGIAGLWSESDDTIHVDQFEGPVEKKIRETGEWLAYNTETQFRISEKQGLEFLFKWALPISLLAMMVVVGVVKLPFLDDFFL